MTTLNDLIKTKSELYKNGLPFKVCKALHATGIYKIKTLQKMCYNDLIKIPGIGDKGIGEIAYIIFYKIK